MGITDYSRVFLCDSSWDQACRKVALEAAVKDEIWPRKNGAGTRLEVGGNEDVNQGAER